MILKRLSPIELGRIKVNVLKMFFAAEVAFHEQCILLIQGLVIA